MDKDTEKMGRQLGLGFKKSIHFLDLIEGGNAMA